MWPTHVSFQNGTTSESVTKSRSYSCCIASSIVISLIGIIFLGDHFRVPLPNINDVEIGEDREGEFERTLITNNPNDYLCSADFVYNEMNTHGDIYSFACAQVTSSGLDFYIFHVL